jgi:hypothetical protein
VPVGKMPAVEGHITVPCGLRAFGLPFIKRVADSQKWLSHFARLTAGRWTLLYTQTIK